MRLKSGKAILTGCSRGLGLPVAEALWREGADLLLVARSEVALRDLQCRLIRTAAPHQQVHVFRADLSDAAAPEAVVAKARVLWPRIDILVNNAGIAGPIGMIADNCWDAWRDTLQVNLLAPIELCRLTIRWMRETGGGNIVNLSGGGATGPRPNFSAYATSKCGIVRFSETIAAEVKELGIRVNCVAPGMLNTEHLQEILRAGPDRVGAAEYERVRSFVAKGGSNAAAAADLIVFLASHDSAGITGKLISAVWDPWRHLHEHLEDLEKTDVYTLRRILPEDRGKAWGAV